MRVCVCDCACVCARKKIGSVIVNIVGVVVDDVRYKLL